MNSQALPLKRQLITLKPTHLSTTLESKQDRIDSLIDSRIILSSGEKLLFVKIDEIVRLEADGNYTQVHLTRNRKHIISKTLKYFMLLLPSTKFIRIHHSHVVNIFHIECIESMKCALMSDNSTVNISRSNRAELKSKIKEMIQ